VHRPHEAGISSPRLLLLLVIASVTLMTLDIRDVGPFADMQQTTRNIVEPFRSAGDTIFDPVGNVWDDVFSGGGNQDELAALREANAKLRNDFIQQANAADLLESVMLQLDISYVGNIASTIATVVDGSIGNFDDFHIDIDRGTNDGVRVGMPVISGGGLIGRIDEADATRSRVILIVDPTFNVGIRVVGSREDLAIVHGGRWDNPLRVDEDINPLAAIEIGAAVVTSGLDGSLYPADIPVGFILSAQVDEGALTQILEVEPSGELSSLRHVTVLLYDPDAEVEP
jgi:rod shape-determining protein MreC